MQRMGKAVERKKKQLRRKFDEREVLENLKQRGEEIAEFHQDLTLQVIE